MKILFVVEDDFPQKGACTSLLKNLFFVGGLANENVTVEVLAAKNYLADKKNESCEGIKVHNAVLLSKISLDKYKEKLFKNPLKVLHGAFKKFLFKMNDDFLDTHNVRSLEKRIKKLYSEECDAVVVVMGGFEIAAAAMNFKINNPNTKLIVYQVDPCSGNEAYPATTRKFREQFEKELFEVSDAIITTPILLDESKKIYTDEITSKITAMEFPNVVPMRMSSCGDNDKIRCLFTGYIYGDFRNPDYCFRLFDEADERISFEMIATVTSQVKNDLKNHRVIYCDRKPLDEVRRDLASADILVNIGNRMLNQVPSKIFEYISYGKPIINICKNRNCPTLPYFEKYPYALNLFEEDEIFEEQVSLLNEFILNNYQKRMPPDEISRVFETCTPQYCAKQMLDVLTDICK